MAASVAPWQPRRTAEQSCNGDPGRVPPPRDGLGAAKPLLPHALTPRQTYPAPTRAQLCPFAPPRAPPHTEPKTPPSKLHTASDRCAAGPADRSGNPGGQGGANGVSRKAEGGGLPPARSSGAPSTRAKQIRARAQRVFEIPYLLSSGWLWGEQNNLGVKGLRFLAALQIAAISFLMHAIRQPPPACRGPSGARKIA